MLGHFFLLYSLVIENILQPRYLKESEIGEISLKIALGIPCLEGHDSVDEGQRPGRGDKAPGHWVHLRADFKETLFSPGGERRLRASVRVVLNT